MQPAKLKPAQARKLSGRRDLRHRQQKIGGDPLEEMSARPLIPSQRVLAQDQRQSGSTSLFSQCNAGHVPSGGVTLVFRSFSDEVGPR
jgi:hypothetical protein